MLLNWARSHATTDSEKVFWKKNFWLEGGGGRQFFVGCKGAKCAPDGRPDSRGVPLSEGWTPPLGNVNNSWLKGDWMWSESNLKCGDWSSYAKNIFADHVFRPLHNPTHDSLLAVCEFATLHCCSTSNMAANEWLRLWVTNACAFWTDFNYSFLAFSSRHCKEKIRRCVTFTYLLKVNHL